MGKTLLITKALADGNRLRVIMALTHYSELCVCQITELLGHATATVSRHMSVLQNAGLVKSRKDGRWVYYRLSKAFPQGLLTWLTEALSLSRAVASDREHLRTIMSADMHDLCRNQKQRKKKSR